MSAYSQYYQYQDQPQVLLTSNNAVGYGHYDSQRSKTPTSLINHTGLSPGPLSTPPMSRNTSQPPEQLSEQPPEHMAWDNELGSLSNSPTSVRTPDGDTFEVEMLDSDESMRNFYQNENGSMVTTQVSQGGVPAMESNIFLTPQGTITDQALQAALSATIASHSQQFHPQYNFQSQQSQNMATSQPYNNFYSQTYTSQPSRQDPWNGQGPPRYSNVPRSGNVIFDPATDTMNYHDFVNDVDYWTMNNTDPNYLLSPNDPIGPQDNLFPIVTQGLGQSHTHNHIHNQVQTHHQSPVEMTVTMASPSPDSQRFVNYNASSSLFTDSYITDSQFPPPSPVASSNGQAAHSPYQASAPSPSSEGMVSSYQHSESGMVPEPYHATQFDSNIPQPIEFPHSPARVVPEVTFDTSPEPEPASRKTTGKIVARPGGRALGTHLEPNVAKAAHDMRKIVACWHCVLQRDKCGPGDICERCLKRSQRPNADCGLGCSRIKLIELAQYFLPTLVTQIHEDAHLTHFVSQYIHQWGNAEITIYMTCGQHGLPRIPVKVYEFVPRGSELLVQIQYKTDPVTHKRIQVKKQSPALGMVHINHNEEKKYDKYISDIVDNHIDAFGELCWMEDDNDFQQKLFRLMTRVKPKGDDEAKLLREVFRLIVVTFIMSHTLTIAEETKVSTLSKMHSYGGPNSYVANFTSPRMTNRQLKYFFCRLHRSIMGTVLNKLQQIFKSSKGCDKWLLAFVAVVGMCMAHEDQQKTVHLVMQTRATTEGLDQRDAQLQADIACREIDNRMGFIGHIFRWKYNRKCNPLRDADHDWDREVGFGDASSVNFVRAVAQLVKENIDFLQVRQGVSISPANQTKYTSRLVGKFLLSFWLPQ